MVVSALIRHILPAPMMAIALSVTMTAMAQNRIDTQLPGAPELAAYGDFKIGVRTVELVNPDQLDILRLNNETPLPDPLPRYDRPLTVELWYPADAAASGSTTINAFIRDAVTEVALEGRAIVGAAAVQNDGPFPLVIISHGYPGNRFLLSHLAENIASKGYVVASIDHTDSTYRTQAAFGSTLVNRSLDQVFVLNAMQEMSADEANFLNGMVDDNNTAIIGYSMGAYGAVITAGAGVTEFAVNLPFGAPHGTLDVHSAAGSTHNGLLDSRIKTAVAFAPWGMNFGLWDAAGLAGISIPMMFIAGSEDDVSGYDNGTRAIWSGATSTQRALLTYDNANHNAGAPYPAPAESFAFNETLGFFPYEHYADAVWDTARMNNISQHFVTAWLGKYLKGESDKDRFLEIIPNSNDGVYAIEDGAATAEHTYWAGFPNRTAKGLHFEWLMAGGADAGCDYSDAAQNAGWGWNPSTAQSCPPETDAPTTDDCDYSDADQNEGWGWDSEAGESCPPR